MVFEKAVSYDIPELVKLRIRYLLEDNGEIDQSVLAEITDNLPGYFQRHLNEDLFVYVCRDWGVIVSCCFLCITEKPSNPSFISGRTGTVMNVYTEPEYREMGLARRLMKMLLDEAVNMKLDFVELKATESGYKMYKSLGFEDTVSRYHNMKYMIGR